MAVAASGPVRKEGGQMRQQDRDELDAISAAAKEAEQRHRVEMQEMREMVAGTGASSR